jgi:putative ABC transport system permease protein
MKFFRNIFDPFGTAINGISAHKLRSFLTMLGIVIGVSAVISLMSIGKGAEAQIISKIQGLGTNLLFIQPGSTSQSGVRTAVGSAQTLTLEDAQDIQAEIQNVEFVAPTSSSFSQFVYNGQNTNSQVTGITPDYQQLNDLVFTMGDPISDDDINAANKVCVLGANVYNTLFAGDDPIGQFVKMGRTNVMVIGVLAPRGASIKGSTDDAVLIPITTLFQTTSRAQTTQSQHIINSITVQVVDPKYITQVEADITDLLRYRHQLTTTDNDFSITSQLDMINSMTQATASMTFLLGAIAAISLLVGGIGVMNIMLVSVIERTREIGIRKALGARQPEIIAQFLLEASFLTLSGGAIGVGVGWVASRYIEQYSGYPAVVTPDIVILAFSISVAIGIVFGLYPAWRGSRLNPIEALRYE